MTTPMRSDVWSLLKRNVSKAQLIGYMAANIVGLAIVLIGVQFFADSTCNDADSETFFSNDYVVMSKRVEGLGFTPLTFSDRDIDDLRAQRWVKKIGRFTASQFAVNGSVSMGGRGLSTYLFCESVPDEFFDVKPRDWQFDPDERFVPIIISKDYLTLYNYGFAIPQGMPQVSEDLVGAVPITLRLTGRDLEDEYFDAAIVGFSSRLNTIAVPQSFMDWANDRYAPGAVVEPSRLIVEVDPLRADEMASYLADHDIEVASDYGQSANISSFLAVVSSVVAVMGLVICVLAIFILILSIFLMLQKSKATLRNIMLLGYAPSDLARYYDLVVICANIITGAAALAITLAARGAWTPRLTEIGIGGASLLPALATLAAFIVGVTILDLIVVSSHLRRIWHNR